MRPSRPLLDDTAPTIVRETTTDRDGTSVIDSSSQKTAIDATLRTDLHDSSSLKTAIDATLRTDLHDSSSLKTAVDATQPVLLDSSPTILRDAGQKTTVVNDASQQLHDSGQKTVVNDASQQLALDDPTSKQPAVVGDDLVPGTMLGDYKIERKVAEGGWGTVFSAVHPLIGKRVAVKLLKKSMCERPDAVKRFIDEARTVNHIGHPNIVDVFTFGETHTGRSYFIMEWLKGHPLSTRIRRGNIPFEEVCAIVKPIARALDAAHAKGIVHRDVKPENVFLVYVPNESLRVKLLDFGIAKLVHHIGMGKTSTGEIIGTPPYMAPEQARGKSVDFKADIYSLGAVLFELLTGRTPFVADNAADEIAALLTMIPPKVSALAPSTPRELDDLVAAMLAKDPDRRPSLRDVCAVLDQLLGRAARNPRSNARPRWTGDRRRPLLALGAAVAAGVLAAVLVPRCKGSEKPDTGRLSLTVSGARHYDVLVDKRPVEVENGEIELAPGHHRIEIRAPGMVAETFDVDTTAGSVLEQSVVLEPVK